MLRKLNSHNQHLNDQYPRGGQEWAEEQIKWVGECDSNLNIKHLVCD